MKFKYRVFYFDEYTGTDGFKYINAKNDYEAINKFRAKYPELTPRYAI